MAIIGSGGYIGSRLYEAIRESGLEVTGYDRDRTYSPFESLLRHNSAAEISTHELRSHSAVIYLGGFTGRAVCEKYPTEVYSENVQDVVKLAKRMTGKQLLIFASTSAILEGTGLKPVSEDWKVREDLLDNYSLSMYKREQTLSSISEKVSDSPRMLGFRFGTVVGHSKSQRQEMAYLAFIKSAFTTGRLDVHHPETARSFLWLTDLERAVMTVLKHPEYLNRYQVYHLSSFDATIGKVASDVAVYSGAPLRIHSHKGRDVVGFTLDSTAFSKKYGFRFTGTSQSVVEELLLQAPDVAVGREKQDSPRDSRVYVSSLCGVCGPGNERDIMTVLDLGEQPLANDFRTQLNESLGAARFPLKIIRCRACNHVQLTHVVNRSSLFSNYLYRSGTTSTLKEHFIRLAKKIEEETPAPSRRNKQVLEIACNDGSQLNQFKKIGWSTYGVDPAANLVKLARNEGHTVKVGFWGVEDFTDILPSELDAIVAQNVLAHVPDPVAFLLACAKYMTSKTRLYIQTSQCDMLERGQFDTAYHEHIHFFTAHSFERLAELTKLRIIDFEIVSIHGRSCLVTFTKQQSADDTRLSFTMQQRLEYEKKIGVTEDFFYAKFRSRALSAQSWVHDQIRELNSKGFKVFGYGAAAKGIVLLHSLLEKPGQGFTFDAIIDDEPMKLHRYCPGTGIPVENSSTLTKVQEPLLIVVFAWNFISEIIRKVRKLLANTAHPIMLLVPFPEQQLFSLNVTTGRPTTVGTNTGPPRPWPLPFRSGRRPVVLYSHFFNEELLSPYWVQHHAGMFDKAYIFDYSSTDETAEIFRKYAPSTWIVKTSRNADFGAHAVDEEIFDAESACDDCWKIALTTTEFFVHENLRDFLAGQDALIDAPRYFIAPMLTMVDTSFGRPLRKFESLISQRPTFVMERPPGFPDSVPLVRYLHNFFSSEYEYIVGRHKLKLSDTSAKSQYLRSGAILKFKLSPWPEVKYRLSEIGDRIPETERGALGIQHTAYSSDLTRATSDYITYSTNFTIYNIFAPEQCTTANEECLRNGSCFTCEFHKVCVKLFSVIA